jgi:predicted kinase
MWKPEGKMSNKPQCILVTGRPGAGKTTLSKRLGQRLWMPVISRDEIKEGYVNTFGVPQDQLPADTNAIVSDLFFDLVYQYLIHKVSIVIEAAFQHPVWEPRMPRIIELSRPYLVVCSVDGETAAKRHLQRGLEDPGREFFHGDRRVAIYRETGVVSPPSDYVTPEFDVPTLHVATEGEYVPSIDAMVDQIRLT